MTPTAQDTRAHLVDLRVGNKPETFAGESHDWKGRQKAAGFSNDEEKTVGLYGKVLNVLEIKFEELGAKYVEGEAFFVQDACPLLDALLPLFLREAGQKGEVACGHDDVSAVR